MDSVFVIGIDKGRLNSLFDVENFGSFIFEFFDLSDEMFFGFFDGFFMVDNLLFILVMVCVYGINIYVVVYKNFFGIFFGFFFRGIFEVNFDV